jgi:hypothetical protein
MTEALGVGAQGSGGEGGARTWHESHMIIQSLPLAEGRGVSD